MCQGEGARATNVLGAARGDGGMRGSLPRESQHSHLNKNFFID